jgi:gas vesicle protein
MELNTSGRRPPENRPANYQNKNKETGMEEKGGFGYFLLGLGIGVAAGILWAPRSGNETRQILADKAGESADYLRAQTEQGKEYLKNQTEQGKEYLRNQTETIKSSASTLYDQGVTTISKQKENLTAAVEAGKQAYRDALADVKTGASAVAANATGSGQGTGQGSV